MKKLLTIAMAAALLCCCKKEDGQLDEVPRLELISVGPAVVHEFKDSLVIVLSYEDGDGDLGGFPADSSNLFVVDKRIDVPFEFRIQELVPGGAEVPIKGKLNIILQNIFLTGSGPEESVVFDIYAYDRAGHKSNVLTTGAVQVVK